MIQKFAVLIFCALPFFSITPAAHLTPDDLADHFEDVLINAPEGEVYNLLDHATMQDLSVFLRRLIFVDPSLSDLVAALMNRGADPNMTGVELGLTPASEHANFLNMPTIGVLRQDLTDGTVPPEHIQAVNQTLSLLLYPGGD